MSWSDSYFNVDGSLVFLKEKEDPEKFWKALE